MKVYRFDTHTGIFLGEDFVASEELTRENGVTVLSPPEHVSGMICCFDAATSSWRLVPSRKMAARKREPDADH